MSEVAIETVDKTITMLPETIECVERLKQATNSPSFSNTVKTCVEVVSSLVESIQRGDRILIEGKKGKQRHLLIYGVNR